MLPMQIKSTEIFFELATPIYLLYENTHDTACKTDSVLRKLKFGILQTC